MTKFSHLHEQIQFAIVFLVCMRLWALQLHRKSSQLGAVHMIPEWVSFQNEFRSRMKFVLHSHDKTDRLSHLENDRFVLHFENDTHAPLAPVYTVCVFISGRSSFSVYMIPEWNVIPEREFHSDWKPEWVVRNKVSFRYHVNRYREIYGDGMNSFWNESHSGIM